MCAKASTAGGLPVGNNNPDEVLACKTDSTRLSDKQRSAIVALRRSYLRNLGVLSRRRQTLTSLLQVLHDPDPHECQLPIRFSSMFSCETFKQSVTQ